MMAKWAAKGLNLGYTIVDSLDDEITVPDGALSGIIANLAIALFPEYASIGAEISVTLAAEATDGMEAIENLTIFIGATEFPSTLPKGSGNAQTGFNDGQRIF